MIKISLKKIKDHHVDTVLSSQKITVPTKKKQKVKVSRKAILPKPEGYVARPPRDDNRSGGRDNRGRDNRGRYNRGRDNRRDDRRPRENKED